MDCSFILLLNILLLVKDSQDYTFITAHNGEVIYVDGLEAVIFSGKIKVLYFYDEVYQTNLNSLTKTDRMMLYTFFSSFVEEEGNEYTNYEHYYELEVGREYTISSFENYLIF